MSDEVWIVRIAKPNIKCPFRSDSDDQCYHKGNISGICKESNCTIKFKNE